MRMEMSALYPARGGVRGRVMEGELGGFRAERGIIFPYSSKGHPLCKGAPWTSASSVAVPFVHLPTPPLAYLVWWVQWQLVADMEHCHLLQDCSQMAADRVLHAPLEVILQKIFPQP